MIIRTIKAIATLFIMGLVVVSCNQPSSGKQYHIRHTQDWVDFVRSAQTIKEIDDCLNSMSIDMMINIFDELKDETIKGKVNDEETNVKARASWWIFIYSGVQHTMGTNRFSTEQWSRFEEIYNKYSSLYSFALKQSIGNGMQIMIDTYAAYIKSGDNQELHYL